MIRVAVECLVRSTTVADIVTPGGFPRGDPVQQGSPFGRDSTIHDAGAAVATLRCELIREWDVLRSTLRYPPIRIRKTILLICSGPERVGHIVVFDAGNRSVLWFVQDRESA